MFSCSGVTTSLISKRSSIWEWNRNECFWNRALYLLTWKPSNKHLASGTSAAVVFYLGVKTPQEVAWRVNFKYLLYCYFCVILLNATKLHLRRRLTSAHDFFLKGSRGITDGSWQVKMRNDFTAVWKQQQQKGKDGFWKNVVLSYTTLTCRCD